jgi:uncharacterized protein YcgI (DUF1989 family)
MSRPVRHEIPPRSGAAFTLDRGQRLTVIDPQGEQVADLVAFRRDDLDEVISSGRTIDYASADLSDDGRPDLLQPLERAPAHRRGHGGPPRLPAHALLGRYLPASSMGTNIPTGAVSGNLAAALAPYGIVPDRIPVAFNVFMHVTVDGQSGEIAVRPPLSRAGDRVSFVAETDLVIGLTACSALQSNNFSFKPIHYEIES